MIQAIQYKLKTGCQWRQLPMKEFFDVSFRWQSVYYHFRKWSQNESWENVWKQVLTKYKMRLDLSSIQLDGTHTPVKRGGEAVAYQGRKKCKTSNILILADNNGIPIACSEAISGHHNDSYELGKAFKGMLKQVESANIRTDGLFLNADAGFDTADFRKYCNKKEIVSNIAQNKRNGSKTDYFFDDLLYKCRFVIERTNAWLDAFKTILVRFETNQKHWEAMHYFAFAIILLRGL